MVTTQYFLFFTAVLLSLVFAVLFIVRKGDITDPISLILKSIASICFIVTSFAAFIFDTSLPTALLVIIGQVFGLLGDIFLDMKYLYRKDEKPYTYTGFIVFLIGHLFFVAFMILTYGATLLITLISLAVAILAALLIYFASEKIAGLVYGGYKVISTIYMFVLAFTMMFAILQIFLNNYGFFNTTKILFAIGMVFFMISDLILAMIYFTPKDAMNKPSFIRLNLAFYYAAQICISVSLVFLLS